MEIPVEKIVPATARVLRTLGTPSGADAGPRVERLAGEALNLLRAEAAPAGIASEIDVAGFAEVYRGDGENDDPSLLPDIFPLADALALFAVTVGAPVSERITALFDAGDPALGAVLDAAASEAAVLAVEHLERAVLEQAMSDGLADEDTRILSYSPGYCGWSLTGQRALFEALKPQEIGIRLTDSCLMEPLKSVSGVAVMGPREIHEFKDDYAFCSECRTRECRHRIRALRSRKS